MYRPFLFSTGSCIVFLSGVDEKDERAYLNPDDTLNAPLGDSLSPDARLPLLGAIFYSVDLSLSSGILFASHWSSSSNSLVALLLDSVGFLSPRWRADALH